MKIADTMAVGCMRGQPQPCAYDPLDATWRRLQIAVRVFDSAERDASHQHVSANGRATGCFVAETSTPVEALTMDATPLPSRQFHPIAQAFPSSLDEAVWHAMQRDIETHGLREPITSYQGQVLDGRIRLRICENLNIAPQFKEFKGTWEEAIAFVWAKNGLRRHLSKSQRALAAVRLADMHQGARTDLAQNCGTSQRRAAEALGVSLRYASGAAALLKAGNENVVRMVERGDIRVATAERLLRTITPVEFGQIVDMCDIRRHRARQRASLIPATAVPVARTWVDTLEYATRSIPRSRELASRLPYIGTDERIALAEAFGKLSAAATAALRAIRKFESGRGGLDAVS
jgi:hypothetical protein